MPGPYMRSLHKEVLPRGQDPDSGAEIAQVTSAAFIHTNIYPEAKVFTPDSESFVYARFLSLDTPKQWWLCHLPDFELRPLGEPGHLFGPALTPDGEHLICTKCTEHGLEISRVSVVSGQSETLVGGLAYDRPYSLGSIDPHGRSYITGVRTGTRIWGILSIDIRTGAHGVLHEGEEIFNPHMQFEPSRGADILVQHNRGGRTDELGRTISLVGDEGATFYLIDRNGGNLRRLPIGKPHTAGVQGHQSWLGNTGAILSTLATGVQEAVEHGNLVTLTPGEAGVHVISRGRHYCHPTGSRDGRYFVADVRSDDETTGEIWLGSIATGAARRLHHSSASFGKPQYSHPHPTFSPDAKTVLFNSDRTGLPQVYVARLPDGLLESLD